MTKVLIVEDELLIANYLKEILEGESYSVVGVARDSQNAVELFSAHSPDIVCMDIKLKGDYNGIETARMLRDMGDFKLVYLTAYGMKDLVVEAQATHPLGFLVKPVTDQTIIATFTTIMSMDSAPVRKNGKPSVIELRLSDGSIISADLASGYITMGGATVTITSMEAKFLKILIEHKGNVVPFDLLRNSIWQNCSVSEASLKTLVWRIRHKLQNTPLIKTVNGFGYCIECEIKEQ